MIRVDWDEKEHPRHGGGAPGGVGGQFRHAGPDWAEKIDAKVRQRRYREVDYGDLEINGEMAMRGGGMAVFGIHLAKLDDFARSAVSAWMDDRWRAAAAMKLRAPDEFERVYAPDPATATEVDDLVRGLGRAVGQGHLTRDAELWRGIVVLEDTDIAELFPLGAEVVDRSFMATSYDQNSTSVIFEHRLQEKGGQRPVLLKVLAPAGTRAAPGAASVTEMILDRGLKTKVIGYDEISNADRVYGALEHLQSWDGPVPVVILELVDSPPLPPDEFDRMSDRDLRDLAAEYGMPGYLGASRAEMLAFMRDLDMGGMGPR